MSIERWKIMRAIWTAVAVLVPVVVVAFGNLDLNVANWTAFERYGAGAFGSVFGLMAFTYPGYRW